MPQERNVPGAIIAKLHLTLASLAAPPREAKVVGRGAVRTTTNMEDAFQDTKLETPPDVGAVYGEDESEVFLNVPSVGNSGTVDHVEAVDETEAGTRWRGVGWLEGQV